MSRLWCGGACQLVDAEERWGKGQEMARHDDHDDVQFGVPVGPVPLQVLPDRDGLLDEVVKVLGDRGGQTCPVVERPVSIAFRVAKNAHIARAHAGPTVRLQDPQDLVSGDEPDLGDSVRVPEDDSDLGRTETPSGELEDLVRDLLGGRLGPRGLGSSVRESRRGCDARRAGESSSQSGVAADSRGHGDESGMGWYSQIPFPGACILFVHQPSQIECRGRGG